MKASTTTIAKGSGEEVRRLHIIYFLSHVGRIEHPHLIRVHHLNRNGVYLRDVKRWMADLRGKDMAEAFAWSYKRRYKNGYVWQDLMDDDLITPICDNEYVLKGSEILPTSSSDANPNGENKAFEIKNDKLVDVEEAGIEHEQEKLSLNASSQASPNLSIDTPTKASSESYQESPISSSQSSTLTEDSMKQEQGPGKFSALEDKYERLSSSYFNSIHLDKKKKLTMRNGYKNSDDDADQDNHNRKSSYGIEKMGTLSSSSFSLSSSESQFAKSKSYSTGASKMLRNLITCGAVDTNDTALVAVNKSSSNKSVKKADNIAHICKGERLGGGSTRVFGTPWNQQDQQYNSRRSFDGLKQQQQNGIGKPKGIPAAYKPVGAPTCSQCGKSFKPEKLHTHMKSCKGMKASAKTATTSFKRNSNSPPPSTKSMNLMAIS